MKKFVSFILIIVTLVSLSFTMAGCSGNYSKKNVTGIYGLERMFYKNNVGTTDHNTYNFAGKYDYYILVLYEDKTGKVILRAEDGEETSYAVTYTLKFKEDEPDAVESVCVEGFMLPQYEMVDGSPVLTFSEPTEATFTFVPLLKDLTYRKYDFRIDNNVGIRNTNLLEFSRITTNTADSKIEKAKKRQIDRKHVRGDDTVTDDEEKD
ncbi:MAG: hypothetical protein ACI3XS_03610 [Eubacteriales bacterium]